MATIRATDSEAYNAGSTYSIPVPGGSVAGDRAFMMVRRNFGVIVPGDWETIWLPLESGFSFMMLITKVLDAGDISAGQINFIASGSGAMGYITCVFEGDVGWRDPFAASITGKGNNGDSDLDSESNVLTGDFCLLWAQNTNWSDETFTLPSGADQIVFHPDSTGVSSCLYSYVPSADGVFTARHHNLWGGTCYQVILPITGAAPPPRRRASVIVC